jgi:hypothetical protein
LKLIPEAAARDQSAIERTIPMLDKPTAQNDERCVRVPLNGGVVPYLMLSRAAEAIEFYKRALGAEEFGARASTDDGRLMNARVEINGN